MAVRKCWNCGCQLRTIDTECPKCGELQSGIPTKLCWQCSAIIDSRCMICPNCGTQQYTVNNNVRQSTRKNGIDLKLILIIIGVAFAAIIMQRATSNTDRETESQKTAQSSTKETTHITQTTKRTTPTTTTQTAVSPEDCFDVVDTATYKNSIGRTVFIQKVSAKQDSSISRTIILEDDNGNVKGKSEDTIHLVKGESNYFKFTFDIDTELESLNMKITTSEASDWSRGTNDGAELLKYNQDGSHLYLTFRQTGNSIEYFSMFKLLFYKNGKIVHDDDGHFSVYAKNMKNKGDEDVASLTVFDVEYDDIEYIFQP